MTAVTLPISAFVIAKNEAPTIGRVIDSVAGLVDEVIVIDSGSTDGTQAICEQKGARVVFNAWPGYGPQKRFGEDLCRNDWVLNLDGDEVVSAPLAAQIRALFAPAPALDGYTLARRVVLPGETAPRRFAPADHWLRLYRRSVMRFADSPVHDKVVIPPGQKIGRLSGVLDHYAFRSFGHLIAKYNSYTDLHAKTAKRKAAGPLIAKALTIFPFAFLKAYVLRRHFVLGWYGVSLALLFAFFRVAKYTKQLERAKGVTQ